MYEYKYILLHNNNYDIYVKIMDVLVIIGTVYFDLISLASPVKSSLNSVCLLFGPGLCCLHLGWALLFF